MSRNPLKIDNFVVMQKETIHTEYIHKPRSFFTGHVFCLLKCNDVGEKTPINVILPISGVYMLNLLMRSQKKLQSKLFPSYVCAKTEKRGVRGGSVDLGGNGSKYTNDMG